MKLHSELSARTVLGRRPRPHHYRVIHPVLAHLGVSNPLNNPTTGAAALVGGWVAEFLMAEQTHPSTVDPAELPGRQLGT